MSLKELALAAAAERSRHEAEERRIAKEQRRMRCTQLIRDLVVSSLAVEPETILPEGEDGGHVLVEGMWFHVAPPSHYANYIEDRNLALFPAEPCPTKEGAFHHADWSLWSDMRYGIRSIADLGAFLAHNRTPSWRCFACREASK